MPKTLSFKDLAEQVLEIDRLERALATAKGNFVRMSGELTASIGSTNGNGVAHDDEPQDATTIELSRPRLRALDGARRAPPQTKRRKPVARVKPKPKAKVKRPKREKKERAPLDFPRDATGRSIKLLQEEVVGLVDMGFTNTELAKKLGIGVDAISRWSRGMRVLSDKHVVTVREFYVKAKAGEVKPEDNGNSGGGSVRRRCFCNFSVRGPSIVTHLKKCEEAAKSVEGLRSVLANQERKSALLAKLVV